MSTVVPFTYSGSVPGADSNTYTLFDTTANPGMAGYFFDINGLKRFKVDLKNIAAGTLNAYRSSDGGRTWIQLSTAAVGVPTYTNTYDWLVEGFRDFKVTWVNGGTTQAAVLTGTVAMTGLTYPTNVAGLTWGIEVQGTRYDINTTGASAAAYAAAVQSIVGASNMTAAIQGGTNFFVLTDALGGGSASSVRVASGTLAMATIGFTDGQSSVGWQVALNATDERHPLV